MVIKYNTNAGLRRIYDQYNDKYFDGSLPVSDIIVSYWNPKDKYRGQTVRSFAAFTDIDPNGPIVLVVNTTLRDNGMEKYVRMSMLHEMCHIHLWVLGEPRRVYSAHGNKFNSEMERLAKEHAFRGLW